MYIFKYINSFNSNFWTIYIIIYSVIFVKWKLWSLWKKHFLCIIYHPSWNNKIRLIIWISKLAFGFNQWTVLISIYIFFVKIFRQAVTYQNQLINQRFYQNRGYRSIYIFDSNFFVYQKSLKHMFQTGFPVQNHLLF